MHYHHPRGLRRVLLSASLFAALAMPFAVAAQDADDDEYDAALMDLIMSDKPLPEADLGEQDNGWFLERKDGACRMYSFNDRLAIESGSRGALFHFQFFDGNPGESPGTQVPMIVLLRDKPEAGFKAFDAVVEVAPEGGIPGYLMPVPLAELNRLYPDGFQLVLLDKEQKRVMQSDTLGSRKHLATLAGCLGAG